MAVASQTQHRLTENMALPYISNSSVVSTDPQWITGSTNIMTSLRQWSERRPGFATPIEPTPTTFTAVARQFLWRKWGSSFFWMVCDIAGGVAKVYKMKIGTDASAVLLWTSATAEPFDFVVSNNTVFFGNGTDMKKYDGTTLSNWGITAPASAPTFTAIAGTLNSYTGWYYVYTYYNSATGHESSPSPLSATTGIVTAKNIHLSLTASADPQVTNIRVYRTTDGGSSDPVLMQEINGSPFANTTTTQDDSTPDTSLGIRVAPEFLRNDPPTPSKGFVAYAGRIWSFINNNTYYSGFEEITNGVPEECWPSGLAGNFYPFPDEITAHASLMDGISVFTPGTIYKIEGDSLDTFRRYTLLQRRGTRSRTTVTSLGGSVAWLDTSNTVWISDIGEIGVPIRPDIKSIDPTKAYIVIHISGLFHWVILLDGANGIVYVYDLDNKIWMPPWTVGTSASALFSGESSVGVIDLLIARNNTKALKLNSASYVDDTSAYSATGISNMYRLTPDQNPSWKGVHLWSEIKTDASLPSQVLQLTDDDPGFATFTDITANKQPSPDITQGTFLLTTRYNSNTPAAQMLSTKFVWPALATNFHLYNMDEAFAPSGS